MNLQPKCEKCERYLSKTKTHKCPKKKKKMKLIDKIFINELDDLNVYIKVLENGCHEWIGPTIKYPWGSEHPITIVYKDGHYSPQDLFGTQLYEGYVYCPVCHYESCMPDTDHGYITYETGYKCRFDDCLNKDHFILFEEDDFFKDYDNGMTIDELVNKYGRSKETFESWIKCRD